MGTPQVRAASHEGTPSGERVSWSTRIVFAAPAHAGEVLPFAHALPPGAHLVDTPDVGERRDATGAIVGLSVARELGSDVVIVLVAPRGETLAAPLVAGDAVQRVSLRGADDPRFEPGARAVRHVGWWGSDAVDDGARHACDAALGGERPALGLYVRATGTLATEGLVGEISTHASRTRAPALAAALVCVVGVGLLVAVWRKLRRDVRVEEAEADLEGAFTRMKEDAASSAK